MRMGRSSVPVLNAKMKDSKSSNVIGESRIAELLSNVSSVALNKITSSKISSLRESTPTITNEPPQASKEQVNDEGDEILKARG